MEQYVSLKNVSFRYEGKGLEALSHFSMGIKKKGSGSLSSGIMVQVNQLSAS